MQRLHALITGRVQGVGFRYFTVREAQLLGLSGFVRNLASRQVEVIAEGEPDQLERLAQRLGVGPPGARVDNLQHTLGPATGEFHGFQVRPSG